jgi:hypothetical protein
LIDFILIFYYTVPKKKESDLLDKLEEFYSTQQSKKNEYLLDRDIDLEQMVILSKPKAMKNYLEFAKRQQSAKKVTQMCNFIERG